MLVAVMNRRTVCRLRRVEELLVDVNGSIDRRISSRGSNRKVLMRIGMGRV